MGAALSAPGSAPYATQQTLAAKLAADRPCVLAFLAPTCGLCASLAPAIAAAEAGGVAAVARIDSSASQAWAPELLSYTVDAVPCFVLTRAGDGAALCKSAPPTSRAVMEAALQAMLKEAERLQQERRPKQPQHTRRR